MTSAGVFNIDSRIDFTLVIVKLVILILLSCLLGSLNLTLTSITLLDLKIYQKTGSEVERKYAKKLLFVRQQGNFLLISLLICNVLVNCSITVLIDYLFLINFQQRFISIFVSLILITIFGGVIPYATSSNGLCIAARAIWITVLFMAISSPISFPIGKLIDKVLGKNMWEAYTRDELRELIIDHGDRGFVNRGEMNIITGALALSTKKVKDIMTRIEESFMLSEDRILDFKTMSEIVSNGYTRVPVYVNDRRNICGLLNTKDLAFIDPNDQIPLKTVCRFYQRNIMLVDAEASLDSMLNEFCQGNAHMAFVDIIKPDENGDLSRQIIGLVTLEDVIEEILQAEILDETDVYDANLHKYHKKDVIDFSLFRSTKKGVGISPEMKLAVCQHLSSNVSVFRPELIQREVLQCLLNEDDIVVRHVHEPGTEAEMLYEEGKPANFAILILEGHVRVILAREKLVCIGGPFIFFGESMLKEVNKLSEVSTFEITKAAELLPPNFPDYTAESVGDLVYLRITRRQYAMARQASILKKTTDIDFHERTRSSLRCNSDEDRHRLNPKDRLYRIQCLTSAQENHDC